MTTTLTSGGPVPISAEQVRHAVSLVAHDLQATLGWEPDRSEAEALRGAQSVAAWDFDGFYPASAYPLKVVEAVQQWLHDTFEHTTWPPCQLRGVGSSEVGRVQALANAR